MVFQVQIFSIFLKEVTVITSAIFFMTWGWATWKNRWETHLNMLENFDDYLDNNLVLDKLNNTVANQQIVHRARISYHDQLDAWDYQWIFSCMANNGLICNPRVNLVQNIGFGDGATHTTSARGKQVKDSELVFPLQHPKLFAANNEIEDQFFKIIFGFRTTLSY